jgi:hypothetical protein
MVIHIQRATTTGPRWVRQSAIHRTSLELAQSKHLFRLIFMVGAQGLEPLTRSINLRRRHDYHCKTRDGCD